MNLDGLIQMMVARIGFIPQGIPTADLVGPLLKTFLAILAEFEGLDEYDRDAIAAEFICSLHAALEARRHVEGIARWN